MYNSPTMYNDIVCQILCCIDKAVIYVREFSYKYYYCVI